VEHFETIRRRKDGTLLDVSLAVSPIHDARGRISGASKIARDIGERKQAEQALKEADRRKNEFLAMLAHELRNPLAPITNALQVMRLTGGDENAVQSAFQMMERQVGQIVRLVDDLLDLSRISRGNIELRTEQVELESVVNHAVEAARPHFESMGQELTVTQPPAPIYLNGDPIRLIQVLGNLLSNAASSPARAVALGSASRPKVRRPSSACGTTASAWPRTSSTASSRCSRRSIHRWSGRSPGWASA
jgi:signal transduction histidine kinase